MKDFFSKVTEIGKKVSSSAKNENDEEELPPVRNKSSYVLEPPVKPKPVEETVPVKTSNSNGPSKNKRAKPRDYNEWAK